MINEFFLKKLYPFKRQQLSSVYEAQPTTVRPVITQGDAENGYVNRYFVRQVNDTTFVVEVDQTQYSKFSSNPRFIATTIKWKVVGKKEIEYLPSGTPVYGVIDINRQTVANADLTFGGLRKYIQDYAQFWVGETI